MCIEYICEKLKISDKRRFAWSFWFFLISLLSLMAMIILFRDKFFFDTVIDNSGYIYRFFWILPFSFMGFSFLAFIASKDFPPHAWRCFCGEKKGKDKNEGEVVCKNCDSKVIDFVERDKPWRSYLFHYIPKLIAISLIIFSVLHLFGVTSGYIYYFFSAGLGLFFGYNIEEFKPEKLKIF